MVLPKGLSSYKREVVVCNDCNGNYFDQRRMEKTLLGLEGHLEEADRNI